MDKKWQLAAMLTLVLGLVSGAILILGYGAVPITGTDAGLGIGGFGVTLAAILYMAGNSGL